MNNSITKNNENMTNFIAMSNQNIKDLKKNINKFVYQTRWMMFLLVIAVIWNMIMSRVDNKN